ncbi:MAG: hypothetical protein ACI9O0_000676 [Paracoccaceae bacterium]
MASFQKLYIFNQEFKINFYAPLPWHGTCFLKFKEPRGNNMVAIETYQIIIVMVFLGLLLALQMWVRTNPKRFTKVQSSRNIQIIEVTAISPQERVTLLRSGGQEFLIFTSKTSGSSMVQIASPPKEQVIAPTIETFGAAQ